MMKSRRRANFRRRASELDEIIPEVDDTLIAEEDIDELDFLDDENSEDAALDGDIVFEENELDDDFDTTAGDENFDDELFGEDEAIDDGLDADFLEAEAGDDDIFEDDFVDDAPECEGGECLDGIDELDDIPLDEEAIEDDFLNAENVSACRHACRHGNRHYVSRRANRYARPRRAGVHRRASLVKPGIEDEIGSEGCGGEPSVSTLFKEHPSVISESEQKQTLKSITARLDRIASYCERHGDVRTAKRIDRVSDLLERG